MLRFEWDRRKAGSNRRKHGVSFDEASTAFRNPLACVFDDDEHSADEKREIIIGHSIIGRLLVVSFVERADGAIRMISARPATKGERDDYERSRKSEEK